MQILYTREHLGNGVSSPMTWGIGLDGKQYCVLERYPVDSEWFTGNDWIVNTHEDSYEAALAFIQRWFADFVFENTTVQ